VEFVRDENREAHLDGHSLGAATVRRVGPEYPDPAISQANREDRAVRRCPPNSSGHECMPDGCGGGLDLSESRHNCQLDSRR